MTHIRLDLDASRNASANPTAADSAFVQRDPDTDKVEHWFRYHAPTADQIPRYNKVRDAAREFAHVLIENCPPSADRTAALRKLRETVMTANASIALEGGP